MAKRGSAEWRRKIGEEVSKAKRRDLHPHHIEAWLHHRSDRPVHPLIRPILRSRSHQAAAMAEDLGGDPTAAQRAMLELWVQTQTIGDAYFIGFMRTGSVNSKATANFSKYASTARSILQALGLERVARDLPSVAEYMVASKATVNVASTSEDSS